MRTVKQKGGLGYRSNLARRQAEECPPGYCTGSTLRDRLGITTPRYKALVTNGMIRATKYNKAGYAIYSDEYLQNLLNRQVDGSLFKSDDAPPMMYTSKDAVLVFRLLEEDMSLRQIVLQTELLPQVVKRIQQDYDDMGASITIPKQILDQINRLRMKLTGPFPIQSATDVLTILAIAAEDRSCFDCKSGACLELCMGCLRKRDANAAAAQANGAQASVNVAPFANVNTNGARAHAPPPAPSPPVSQVATSAPLPQSARQP